MGGWTVCTRAFVKVAFIHTGRQQGVALKVQHLPVTVRGHAHVADQHVRKTPHNEFSHTAPFRHGLSCIFAAENAAISPAPRARRKSPVFRQGLFARHAPIGDPVDAVMGLQRS